MWFSCSYDPTNQTRFSVTIAIGDCVKPWVRNAKERADAEEVARLEANKNARKKKQLNAWSGEQIAQANQRNLSQAQEALARQEEETR